MPLYEYECKECHRRTEKIQKFSDAELTVCPHCGGSLERTLTAPAIQFKGSGWYKDLYSSAKPAAPGESAGGEATTGALATEASAPAAKTDAPASAAAAASAPSTSSSTGSTAS